MQNPNVRIATRSCCELVTTGSRPPSLLRAGPDVFAARAGQARRQTKSHPSSRLRFAPPLRRATFSLPGVCGSVVEALANAALPFLARRFALALVLGVLLGGVLLVGRGVDGGGEGGHVDPAAEGGGGGGGGESAAGLPRRGVGGDGRGRWSARLLDLLVIFVILLILVGSISHACPSQPRYRKISIAADLPLPLLYT